MFVQDKIINFLKTTGPTLPAKVAKHIGTEILIASAYLSDLAAQKKVKISVLKVGGSPLYYLSGQESRLYQFVQGNANPKDIEVLERLKKESIFREKSLDLLSKVALRSLKDFAVPLHVTIDGNTELFWKWHLLSDEETNSAIGRILSSFLKESSLQKPVLQPPEEGKEFEAAKPKTELQKKLIPEDAEEGGEEINAERTEEITEEITEEGTEERDEEVGDKTKDESEEKDEKKAFRSKDAGKEFQERRRAELPEKEEKWINRKLREKGAVKEKEAIKEREKERVKDRETKFKEIKERLVKEQEKGIREKDIRKGEIFREKEENEKNEKNEENEEKGENEDSAIMALEESPKPVKEKAKKKGRPATVDTFFVMLEKYFKDLNIVVGEKEVVRKNSEFNLLVKVPSVVGRITYFCKVKSKSKCDEKDLSLAYMEAQIKKLPLLFLYTNEVNSKAREMLDSGAFENTIVKKIE